MARHKYVSSTERYRTDNIAHIIMRILELNKDYFWKFYNPFPQKIKDKVDYVLQIVISLQKKSPKFLKHLGQGIYKIRIKMGSNIYRIFTFLDVNKLEILLHGFQKKT